MLDAPAPVHLHYATEGSGPPMVLLHGFPQTRLAWAPVADRLAPTFTVVRPDLRGYGESPKPPTGYSKRAMAEDVLALMRGLGHKTLRSGRARSRRPRRPAPRPRPSRTEQRERRV